MIPRAAAAARSLHGPLLLLALALGSGGSSRCAPGPAPLPLATRFAEAELRSDGFDLPFLVGQGALGWPDWQDPAEDEAAPIVWSLVENAGIDLPIATRAPKLLSFRARCDPRLGPRLPLTLRLGDRPLGSVELTPTEAEFRFVLEAEAQVPGQARLVFSVPRRYIPPKGERDERPAAVGLSALQLSRVGRPGAQSVPRLEDSRLRLPPGSSVAFYVRLGRAGQLSARATGRGGELEAWLQTDTTSASLGARNVEDVPHGVSWPVSAPAGYARLEIRSVGSGAVALDEALLRGVDEATPPPSKPARLDPQPSVLIFLTDTLRADRLSSYGFEKATSPNLDAFARDAIRFDDAWAQSSWTRPTVASLFTGLPPSVHQAIGFDRPLAGRFTTLAEVLKAARFRTGAIVANHVVHHRFGFAQGFEVWNDGESKLYGISAPELVERALKFVDAAPRPFFLYLHTMEPHATYEPSDAAYRRFAPAGEPRRESRPLLMAPHWTPETGAYLDALYQGEVWDNDRAFGLLLDGLRSRGLLDSTLVIFTADHGEEFLDHGGKGHGQSLYRELIRVPFLVRLPRALRGGSIESAAIAQVDLLPTLASLLGVAAPKSAGRDLSGLWLGRVTSLSAPELLSETRFGLAEKQALRVGALKLILNHDPRRYGRRGGPPELYDVGRDPGETVNLLGRLPVSAEWMKRRLALRLLAQQRQADAVERVEVTPEEREALEALGYIQGGAATP